MSRGGARPGAGRKPGSPNKATAEIRDLARRYVPKVIKELARLATEAESETARVAAGNSILDRAYGKPSQPIEHELDLSSLTDEQIAALALALGARTAPEQSAGRDREAPTAH